MRFLGTTRQPAYRGLKGRNIIAQGTAFHTGEGDDRCAIVSSPPAALLHSEVPDKSGFRIQDSAMAGPGPRSSISNPRSRFHDLQPPPRLSAGGTRVSFSGVGVKSWAVSAVASSPTAAVNRDTPCRSPSCNGVWVAAPRLRAIESGPQHSP